MDIETLRLFTEVVARQGISEAARRNNMSQQTLSRRIIVLEEELGTTLLDRSRHSEPTAAGKVFLEYAYDVLSLTAKMRSGVKRASMGATGRLCFKRYATESFFQIATRTVDRLERRRPGVKVELVSKNEDDASLVLDGLIDLGFARYIAREGERPVDPDDGLRRVPLRSNSFPLVFGVAHGHPLLDVASPTLADIGRYRIATPSFASNGPIPEAMRCLFEREGIDLRLDMVVCHSMLEYYAYAGADSVVVFNEAFRPETAMGAHGGFVAVEASDGPYLVCAQLVYSPLNGNPALAAAVGVALEVDEELAE